MTKPMRAVLILVVLIFVSMPAVAQAEEWEHMILVLDGPYIGSAEPTAYPKIRDRYPTFPFFEGDLNALGRQGWMIASVVIDGQGRYVIFLQRKI